MDAATYANGLRDFADWIEANEEHIAFELAAADAITPFQFNLYATSRKSFAEYVRALGRGTKSVDDAWFNVRRKFGPVEVRVYTARAQVCQKVVTGTREVKRQVRDPQALEQVPLVTVTETVEDVEWICEESILADVAVADEVSA